jgi:hypothetical protein
MPRTVVVFMGCFPLLYFLSARAEARAEVQYAWAPRSVPSIGQFAPLDE